MADEEGGPSEGRLSSSVACGLQDCVTVCPSNVTDFYSTLEEVGCRGGVDGEVETPVVALKFLTGTWGAWIVPVAERFSRERPDVNVEIVQVELSELSPNIINEATSKTGLFDGFVTPPAVMGSIVEEDGWADLTAYIDSSAAQAKDWSDIFLNYRKWISQYQEKILMFPLDGDVLSLFYRKDVLEEFGLHVPRTWEEYNAVAAATHGKEFKNRTLTGSCIGRMMGCAGPYWANLVLSSMTQQKGTWEGHLFDSSDMTPLLDEAFIKTLELLEYQTMYGQENEFEGCVDINEFGMKSGTCVLSYNWGTFKIQGTEGSIFRDGDGEMGVAETPGSTHVLDRVTRKLVPCNKDICPFGAYYDDIGWVNRAPYLAFGGWSCAVNNYTTPGKKNLSTEFCAYASSREQSNILVAENATTAVPGPDPFRSSQLDVDLWVANGYRREGVEEYFGVIKTALMSENAVTDIRFPTSSLIYAVLDEEVYTYLNGTMTGKIPESDRAQARKVACDRISEKFREIISNYDSQASTRMTALEQYQKLMNVYTVDYNTNQLGGGILAYGFAMASVTMLTAVGFALWAHVHRTSPVVRASQPFFLILICAGVFVLASSIFPMAIDDGFASQEACDRACMAIPWLVAMGWSVLFAALYAKIRRVNLVISNAMAFRSVKVSERDVMLPFAFLFTSNLILLTVWTVYDPLIWGRVQTSPTDSHGTCMVQEDSTSWKIIVSFLGLLNGAALVAANVEAYKARKVDTDYGESSYIGLIMGSYLQIVMVGLPLYFLVQDNPTAKFFVSSSMVFLMSMSVLLLLFIPKWRNWRKNPVGPKEPTVTVSGLRLDSRHASVDSQSSSPSDPMEVTGALYVQAWNTRVLNLEKIMVEAGIEPNMTKNFLTEAKLLGRGQPVSAPLFVSNTNSNVRSVSGLPSASYVTTLDTVTEVPWGEHNDDGTNISDKFSMVSPEAVQEQSVQMASNSIVPPNDTNGTVQCNRITTSAERVRHVQPMTSVHLLEGMTSVASSINERDLDLHDVIDETDVDKNGQASSLRPLEICGTTLSQASVN